MFGSELAQRMGARFARGRTAETRAAYRRVFETEDGQVVLADLIKFAGAGRETFVAGQADATAYNIGMQRLILRITAFLEMTDREVLRISKMEDGSHGNDQV